MTIARKIGLSVSVLRADNGDAIRITVHSVSGYKNILIDGGEPSTYMLRNKKRKKEPRALKALIDELRLKRQRIDLLIMTHVDDDHIGGILRWFETDPQADLIVERVWFNSGSLIRKLFPSHEEIYKTSIGQGVKFEDYIQEKGIWEKTIFLAGNDRSLFGLTFQILSPTKKNLDALLKKWKRERPESLTSSAMNDYGVSLKTHIQSDSFHEDIAVHNGSSIAFIIKLGEKNLLFLGDSHPSVIVESLSRLGYSKENKLKCELVKLSHHGSKSNTSRELLQMIKCRRFLISTNGVRHSHPDKQLIARLVSCFHRCDLYFNYPELIESIISEQDRKDFPGLRTLEMPRKISIRL